VGFKVVYHRRHARSPAHAPGRESVSGRDPRAPRWCSRAREWCSSAGAFARARRRSVDGEVASTRSRSPRAQKSMTMRPA
jgi:hypothetical protein